MGLRSIMPVLGITRRMGARMGSVIWYMKATRGLFVLGPTASHDTITLARIAALSAHSKMFTKVTRMFN